MRQKIFSKKFWQSGKLAVCLYQQNETDMKNYNTLEALEKYYITNDKNKSCDGSQAWGENVWYFKDITIMNSFRAFAMVNVVTRDYMLRCDPIDDEQYNTYEEFICKYDYPEWIMLS